MTCTCIITYYHPFYPTFNFIILILRFCFTIVFQVSDIGGSIAIHTFGAYFGLGVSAALRMKKVDPPQGVQRLDGPSYVSDTTAMIGEYKTSRRLRVKFCVWNLKSE